MPIIITLNVGGQQYQVSQEKLLLLDNTYFTLMFDINEEISGAYFIDRGYEQFGYILKYIRDKKINIRNLNYDEANNLLDEAKFYNIQPLINLIENQIKDHGKRDDIDVKNIKLKKAEDKFNITYKHKKINDFFEQLNQIDKDKLDAIKTLRTQPSTIVSLSTLDKKLDFIVDINNIQEKYKEMVDDLKKQYHQYL